MVVQRVTPGARAEARQGHSGAWAWATARETAPNSALVEP